MSLDPNETVGRGRITKRGDKLMRTAFVQCTLVAIRYPGYLNALCQRIKEQRGSSKAIIATARKLLSIIHDAVAQGQFRKRRVDLEVAADAAFSMVRERWPNETRP